MKPWKFGVNDNFKVGEAEGAGDFARIVASVAAEQQVARCNGPTSDGVCHIIADAVGGWQAVAVLVDDVIDANNVGDDIAVAAAMDAQCFDGADEIGV